MLPSAFDQQYLSSGDGHTLYVAQYGQPDAPAAVVLHGGPGSGTQPSVLEWFDLNRQRVVLFDQRGAGRSTPAGEITHNDSSQLVADIEMIRTHLSIPGWMVVGGSWGATLALMYAGQHTERVSSLILRGSFLASPREMQWFFQSLQAMVPHGWAQLTRDWSESEQAHVLATLSRKLLQGSAADANDAAARWGRYEDAVMQAMSGKLSAPETSPVTQEAEVSARQLGKYRLQAHYLSNGCFTSEQQLLNFAAQLKHVPTVIVHGTHDLICPPDNAQRLATAMPHARLQWVARGEHTPADTGISTALRDAVHQLAGLN